MRSGQSSSRGGSACCLLQPLPDPLAECSLHPLPWCQPKNQAAPPSCFPAAPSAIRPRPFGRKSTVFLSFTSALSAGPAPPEGRGDTIKVGCGAEESGEWGGGWVRAEARHHRLGSLESSFRITKRAWHRGRTGVWG